MKKKQLQFQDDFRAKEREKARLDSLELIRTGVVPAFLPRMFFRLPLLKLGPTPFTGGRELMAPQFLQLLLSFERSRGIRLDLDDFEIAPASLQNRGLSTKDWWYSVGPYSHAALFTYPWVMLAVWRSITKDDVMRRHPARGQGYDVLWERVRDRFVDVVNRVDEAEAMVLVGSAILTLSGLELTDERRWLLTACEAWSRNPRFDLA